MRQAAGPMHRADCLLLFEDGGTFFVGHDRALEFAKGRSLVSGDLDLADNVFALVVELVGFGRDGGVVAGEVLVDTDGIGHFIDDESRREGNVVAVVPAAGGAEVDGESARLVVKRLHEGADDTGADEQERAGLMGILAGGELVVEFQGPVELGWLDKLERIEDYAGNIVCYASFPEFAALFVIGVFEERSVVGAFGTGVAGVDGTG